MITNLSHVMTLANSVIGVSVLAMPYCFKQCGIFLAILMLLLSSLLSKFACHLLVKSAVMSRRRNFEILAFHAFGRTGKFLAELFIIGFLMGTCIAFFVVVGDLGPEIVGKMIDKSPDDIRTSLLVMIGIFIILPLGLLRNVDSLSTICTATIGFYLCLVLKVMTESMTHIFATDWYDKVFYWRPSGILQCLPIFSMALFCQTQLFEIYETIPNVCLEKMNQVVHVALNICTVVYVCVGFFGYIAFCTMPFTGNILMSFEPSLSSEAIKIGFVLSVAFSFPLVIFPCRASLNSLLFRWAHSHETGSNYIPETRFRWLTFLIVCVSLVTGILIPNIEFVLGLVGSTIGVMICLMFPAAFFISISSKNTNERLVAQAMLFIGIWIMILGTYANLYAMEESANAKLTATTGDSSNQLNNIPIQLINEGDAQVLPPLPKIDDIPNDLNANFKPLGADKIHEIPDSKDDVRQEPPIPVERVVVTEKADLDNKKSDRDSNAQLAPAVKKIKNEIKESDKNVIERNKKEKQKYEMNKNLDGMEKAVVMTAPEKVEENVEKNSNMGMQKVDNLIHSDAIKKEESELAADAELAAESELDKKEELKKTLVQHEIELRQMLQEQKEILNKLNDFNTLENNKIAKEKIEQESNKKVAVDVSVVKNDNENAGKHDQVSRIVENKSESGKIKIKLKKDAEPSLNQDGNNETMKNLRGPILSALVKQTSNSSIVNKFETDLIRNSVDAPESAISNVTKNQNIEAKMDLLSKNNDVAVPIALIMSEKTKKDDKNVVIGRDILENQDRTKRDIHEIVIPENPKQEEKLDFDFTDKTQNDFDSFVNKISPADSKQKCVKTDESQISVDDNDNDNNNGNTDIDNKNNDNNDNNNNNNDMNNDNNEETSRSEKSLTKRYRNVREKVTTELLLIKTNSYLSDQNFIEPNSFDKTNFGLDIGIKKSNQRDLKSISSKKNK